MQALTKKDNVFPLLLVFVTLLKLCFGAPPIESLQAFKKKLSGSSKNLVNTETNPYPFRPFKIDCGIEIQEKQWEGKIPFADLFKIESPECMQDASKYAFYKKIAAADKLGILKLSVKALKSKRFLSPISKQSYDYPGLFKKNDIGFLEDFFQKDTNCHEFWRSQKSSINSLLASNTLSRKMKDFLKRIVSKDSTKDEAIISESTPYFNVKYDPTTTIFEFTVIDFCHTEHFLNRDKNIHLKNYAEIIKGFLNDLKLHLEKKLHLHIGSYLTKLKIKDKSSRNADETTKKYLYVEKLTSLDPKEEPELSSLKDQIRASLRKLHSKNGFSSNFFKDFEEYVRSNDLLNLARAFKVASPEIVEQNYNPQQKDTSSEHIYENFGTNIILDKTKLSVILPLSKYVGEYEYENSMVLIMTKDRDYKEFFLLLKKWEEQLMLSKAIQTIQKVKSTPSLSPEVSIQTTTQQPQAPERPLRLKSHKPPRDHYDSHKEIENRQVQKYMFKKK
ncbi:hypothetical protein HMI54_006030 [Coelomomyces lativittatus]|nr:hypothetical protein HMI54_006030 [Coelomomyces lativittatus]